MAEFNPYNLYSMAVNQSVSNSEDVKNQEIERISYAFFNFHKPETYEERKKFVNDVLQGRNYSQTIEFEGETMAFDFTDEFVRVTLHSPVEDRNNRFFQYSVKND